MVRILSNGDIVQDDDTSPSTSRDAQQRGNSEATYRRAPQNEGTPSSPFSSVNARLAEYGVPTYSIYGVTIQPIHLVLTVISVLLFGIRSLLFIALLLFITSRGESSGQALGGDNGASRARSSAAGGNGSRQSRDDNGSESFPGAGHTLGKS